MEQTFINHNKFLLSKKPIAKTRKYYLFRLRERERVSE